MTNNNRAIISFFLSYVPQESSLFGFHKQKSYAGFLVFLDNLPSLQDLSMRGLSGICITP